MCNLHLWTIVWANTVTVFVLTGMASWWGLYLVEAYSTTASQAAEIMLWNELGGLAGSLLCGVVSDALGGRRCLTCLLFACVCLPGYWCLPISLSAADPVSALHKPMTASATATSSSVGFGMGFGMGFGLSDWGIELLGWDVRMRACLFALGMGINGPKTLLSMAVRDAVPMEIAASAGGVFGLVGQVGASASGYGLGHALERYGWSSFVHILHHATLLLVVLLLPPALLLSPTRPPTKVKSD